MYHPDKYAMPDFDRSVIMDFTYNELKTLLRSDRIGSGSTRKCYAFGADLVIKLPDTDWIGDAQTNITEYITYLNFKFAGIGTPAAPCELVFAKDGTPVIVMVRVTIVSEEHSFYTNCGYPSWVCSLQDGQIGIIPASGELVCYDAGYGTDVWINPNQNITADEFFAHL